MCGCDKHNDPTAECTCICEEHGNFKLVQNLALSRYDTIVELQKATAERAERALLEYRRHDWSARSMFCACGGFFEATMTGNEEHARHRMLHALAEGLVL